MHALICWLDSIEFSLWRWIIWSELPCYGMGWTLITGFYFASENRENSLFSSTRLGRYEWLLKSDSIEQVFHIGLHVVYNKHWLLGSAL